VIVFGHTHRQISRRDPRGRLVINPGSAGPSRFNLQPGVALLTVVDRDARVEIIALV
jgi:predicted phosphodiesterase